MKVEAQEKERIKAEGNAFTDYYAKQVVLTEVMILTKPFKDEYLEEF